MLHLHLYSICGIKYLMEWYHCKFAWKLLLWNNGSYIQYIQYTPLQMLLSSNTLHRQLSTSHLVSNLLQFQKIKQNLRILAEEPIIFHGNLNHLKLTLFKTTRLSVSRIWKIKKLIGIALIIATRNMRIAKFLVNNMIIIFR